MFVEGSKRVLQMRAQCSSSTSRFLQSQEAESLVLTSPQKKLVVRKENIHLRELSPEPGTNARILCTALPDSFVRAWRTTTDHLPRNEPLQDIKQTRVAS
jgi:hypothetical protein